MELWMRNTLISHISNAYKIHFGATSNTFFPTLYSYSSQVRISMLLFLFLSCCISSLGKRAYSTLRCCLSSHLSCASYPAGCCVVSPHAIASHLPVPPPLIATLLLVAALPLVPLVWLVVVLCSSTEIWECCVGWPYGTSFPKCHHCCQRHCCCCFGRQCCGEVCGGLLVHLYCCRYCQATAEKKVLPRKHGVHWLCWYLSSKPWRLPQRQWGMRIVLNTVVMVPLSSSLLSLSLRHNCPAVNVIIVFVSHVVDAPALHNFGCNDRITIKQRLFRRWKRRKTRRRVSWEKWEAENQEQRAPSHTKASRTHAI